MTYAICMAFPKTKLGIKSVFSSRISFEAISDTTLGKAVIGNKSNWEAFLPSLDGRAELLLDRGQRRHRASSLIKEGVRQTKGLIPAMSFIEIWLNSTVWEQEFVNAEKAVLDLEGFALSFPASIELNVRYTVITADASVGQI